MVSYMMVPYFLESLWEIIPKWPNYSEGIGTSFPVATLLGCACELCHVIQLCSTPCPIDQPHQDL